MTELLSPRDERAVAGDLIVFDRLRVGDDRRIEHGFVLDFAGGLIGFFDEAVDGRAVR